MKEIKNKGGELAKDPICGMVVPKETALKREVGGRTYYFCSESCVRTFESPDKELKDMKRRVTIAISGVLILALLRAGFFLGLAAGATILTWAPIPWLPWFRWGIWLFIITTPIMIFGGKNFLIGAYNAIKKGTPNMDLLITIGVWTAYLYSAFVVFFPNILPVKEKDVYFEVAAVIIAFVLLGKYMEEMIKKRSSAAVRKLLDLKPAMAKILQEDKEMEIPVEAVKSGDVVIVRPGDKLPVDGIVIEGSSAVDEKMITGESIPVMKNIGHKVIGGTINKQGVLKIEATNVGQDSTLMQIVKMVEEAQLSSVKIQRLVDKIASYFVPAVIAVALITFIGWNLAGNFPLALLSFIAVLIIACPCALGVATPAALLAGVGKGAERGILIRSGDVLERAEKIQTVVFDKTGTLTKGEAEVTDIIAFDFEQKDVLRLAAVAEKGSEHPLARAIVRRAQGQAIEIKEGQNYQTEAGKGIKCQYENKTLFIGNKAFLFDNKIEVNEDAEKELASLEGEGKTAIILASDSKVLGIFGLADSLKEFSKEAVQILKEMKKEVWLITGDNEKVGKAIARQLAIDEDKIMAQVLPQHKAEKVQELKEKGRIVAFVGDGINDAPALVRADIGIAIGSGSDIAKESGGIILIRDDLRDVVASIKLSVATMRKIKQNLFWALIYNSIGIPIAAFGLLNPIIAAAAMALSSLSVVSNSALLRRLKIQ